MKILVLNLLKLFLRIIYAPLKLLKTKNRIVYLSRQSNDKSLDMRLLEEALKKECPETEQVFRLKMLGDGFKAKIDYALGVIGDMYFLATSMLAIVDTYSLTVSCLHHKKSLKVLQMWHALGATKKFGWQSVGTKEGRDEKLSKALCMHKNYDYVLAPSSETAKFYMEGFGVDSSKIKICPLPRVDFLTDGKARTGDFFYNNPAASGKKTVLYVPTFREGEESAAEMLKAEFSKQGEFELIISPHPLSKVRKDENFLPKGEFTSADLMKIADIIITDYSACAYEAAVLMKPLYFFVPDYNDYMKDRGINVNIYDEMPSAVFEDAKKLLSSIKNEEYDFNSLYSFKEKYVETAKSGNTETLAKFIKMVIGD